MTPGDKVRVVKLLDADRAAGNSTCKKPPKRIIGKVETIRRPISSWDAFWVSFGRGRLKQNLKYTPKKPQYPEIYVFAREELEVA